MADGAVEAVTDEELEGTTMIGTSLPMRFSSTVVLDKAQLVDEALSTTGAGAASGVVAGSGNGGNESLMPPASLI